MRNRTLSLAVGALLLVACKNGNDSPPAADKSLVGLASAEIANNTTDTALPIDLNGLEVSEAGTDDTSLPAPIN